VFLRTKKDVKISRVYMHTEAMEEFTLRVLDGQVPSCIREYTPEECTLMLQVGSQAIESLKLNKVRLDNQAQIQAFEVTKQEMQDQFLVQLQERENKLDEMTKTMEDKNANYQFAVEEVKRILRAQCTEQYQDMLHQKDQHINELKEILALQRSKVETMERSIQLESKKLYEIESRCTIDRFSLALEKLDQGVQKVQEISMDHTKQKSMYKIGDMGENLFSELATESFRFFPGFDMINVANETAKGDFHLFFKDFSVLVDVKNWDTMVQNGEREKLQRDLLCNDMMFGWMVSLKSDMRKFDNFPISVEWLRPDKCIIYLNSVMKQTNPIEFLRLAWNFCNTMYQLHTKNPLKTESAQDELTVICSHVQRLDTITKEETSIMNDMAKELTLLTKNMEKIKECNKTAKDIIKESLNTKSTELLNNMYNKKVGRKPRAKKAADDAGLAPGASEAST